MSKRKGKKCPYCGHSMKPPRHSGYCNTCGQMVYYKLSLHGTEKQLYTSAQSYEVDQEWHRHDIDVTDGVPKRRNMPEIKLLLADEERPLIFLTGEELLKRILNMK